AEPELAVSPRRARGGRRAHRASPVPSHALAYGLCMQVDVVEGPDQVPGLDLVGVERPQVLSGLAVEMEPGDRFPVVVVEDDGEVALGVALRHPVRSDLAARDGLDD